MRQVAEKQGVAAKMIATADELDLLAGDDNADVPALKGWRRELFGAKALQLKHGRLALTVENNRVVTLEWHEVQDDEEPSAVELCPCLERFPPVLAHSFYLLM